MDCQSPIIIITGEQLSSYEYGLLQAPIFGPLIAGNLPLARLTSRCTVRSLIITGGWPIIIGLLVAAAATVISSHAYLWMTAGLEFMLSALVWRMRGLVRLTLFASDMSKVRFRGDGNAANVDSLLSVLKSANMPG